MSSFANHDFIRLYCDLNAFAVLLQQEQLQKEDALARRQELMSRVRDQRQAIHRRIPFERCDTVGKRLDQIWIILNGGWNGGPYELRRMGGDLHFANAYLLPELPLAPHLLEKLVGDADLLDFDKDQDPIKGKPAATATTVNQSDGPALSEPEQEILEVLLDLKACSQDKRKSKPFIAQQIGGNSYDPEKLKGPVRTLMAKKLIASVRGRAGGLYLTAAGCRRAKMLREEPQ